MPLRLCIQVIFGVVLFMTSAPSLVAETPRPDTAKLKTVYAMYGDYRQRFPEVVEMGIDEAQALSKAGRIQFVDVREPEEIAVSTLPGAIDKQTFLQSPERFKDTTVVAFCTISYRSGLFAQEMALRGLAVHNLRGGILAWSLEGGKVFDALGPSQRLHVYGPKWDLAPKGFESVQFGWLERLSQ